MEILFLRSETPVVVSQDDAHPGSRIVTALTALGTVTVAQVGPFTGRESRLRRWGDRRRSTHAPDSFTELRRDALSCDVLITSGWAALIACERMHVLSDVHLIEDLRSPVDPAAAGTAEDEARKFELVNRARRILVLSADDGRQLRARGRFPTLLVTDEDAAAPDPSSPAGVVPVGRLADWVRPPAPAGHAEPDLAQVLRSAAQRSIPDLPGLLSACLADPRPGRIQTVNLQHIWLARTSPVFRETIGTAREITADGWPIVRLLNSAGYAVDRVTGADLVQNLLSDPRARGLRLALIGGAEEPGTAFEQLAVQAGAAVVLRDHGDKRDWDPAVLAAELNARQAGLALVAVTQPVGDLLVAELTAAGYRGTAIGIGAAVDLFVGGERRAAPWVQRLRLEWFFRFLQDPKRLWRRYFLEGIPTYLKVVLPMTRRRTLAPAQPQGNDRRAADVA